MSIKLEYDETSFHDLPIEGLNIDFSTNTLEILILLFDEKTNIDEQRTIIFKNISNLAIENFYTDDFKNMEIYSCEFKNGISKKTHVKIVLLTGFGKQSMTISFEFDDTNLKEL